MSAKLRLSVFDLADGETLLPEDDERVHFVYVRNGSARIAFDGTAQELATDDGCFAHGRVMVAPGSDVWLFEKSTTAAPPLDAEIVASYPAPLAFDGPFIIRADRIESRHGAQTPRHRHRGPGMRRLIHGTLRAELGDSVQRIGAGDAWFESGQEPVVGTNYGGTKAAFVRLLVLPAELRDGLSSFVAADPHEARKSRAVDQRLFGEIG